LVSQVDLVVSTQKLNRIVEHAVEDLTVSVEAGVKLADLQQRLRAAGQFLPLDPAYPETATLGGILATADAGSWRQRYGGVRDLVLGLSVVRADGEIAKAGGKVVKNVAGYDLMKLFVASYGTLGIISEVTLRTYPLLKASQTVAAAGDESAIAKLTESLLCSALTPTAIDLLSTRLVEDLALGNGFGLLVRFQSLGASVEEQSQRL
ncbi:MAG: FAD-binding oxidoreductase, partial [Okeania sp. SIO2D1]|nr:FAD-binding oxidoreductase [Okeania sp. SIO2D1]